MKTDNNGRKDDQGKLPWHLFAWDAAAGVVEVLRFGAVKYEARNWERGMDWSRPYSACIRHLTAWWGGEKNDPETGLPHLAHAGCCVMFLAAYEIRGVGTDDRPGTEKAWTHVETKVKEATLERPELGDGEHVRLTEAERHTFNGCSPQRLLRYLQLREWADGGYTLLGNELEELAEYRDAVEAGKSLVEVEASAA